jgi:hypothetical protein
MTMARYTITIEVEAEEGDVDARDMAPAVNGMLDRCGLRAAERVEVREGGEGIDAARLVRLRTLAYAGAERLVRDSDRIRKTLRDDVAADGPIMAHFLAATAQRLALAEAREEGYRAAVNDLLGALEVGQ